MATSRASRSWGKKNPVLYIKTFGCQMNVRDSQLILGLLQKAGYQQTQQPAEADVILFNTCSVRRHAEERVWGQVGALKKLNKNGDSPHLHLGTVPIFNKKIVGIVGCMGQNYQAEILKRMPHVDFVCGPANIYDIPHLIARASQEKRQLLAVDREQRPMLMDESAEGVNLRSFVSIMYGCNNFCSYCIVPYVRGRERSRPLRHILNEVRDLAQGGCKEITLLGQNVNSYGKDLPGEINFVKLLQSLDRVKGIERIRFVTSHPRDASLEMFRAMRDLPKLCEHLHLPLQSGSDKILKAMNRRYTLGDYLKLVDKLRNMIPDCSLTTDIIVGFPGETEKDFRRTYQGMQDIQFDEAFIFKYSVRPKTRAAQLPDDVALSAKQTRNQELLRLQERISTKKNQKLLGASVQVLTEGPGRLFAEGRKRNMLQGKTRTAKVTLFPGSQRLISQIVDVRITRTLTHTLVGELNGQNS